MYKFFIGSKINVSSHAYNEKWTRCKYPYEKWY